MSQSALAASTFAVLAFSASVNAGELHQFTSDAAGFYTHSYWYDDGHEVTVIDAQFTPDIANQLIGSIHATTKSPITRVIVTHPNPDKFNGLSAFHAIGVKSIASAKTSAAMAEVDHYKRYFWVEIAKAFTADNYPKLEPVTTTFDQQLVVTLQSGETISLFELGHPGVASDQTVVRIDQSGDLVVGDLVHYRNHAWLEGGIRNGSAVTDLAGWKADLQQLMAISPTATVYGGRGASGPVADVVAAQSHYLDVANEVVATVIKELGPKVGELRDPALNQGYFALIQARMVQAFPDYAMPDLVGFSVYGLVQTQLAEAGH